MSSKKEEQACREPECNNQTFTTNFLLRSHTREKHENKLEKYTCPGVLENNEPCRKKYARREYLLKHFDKKHRGQKRPKFKKSPKFFSFADARQTVDGRQATARRRLESQVYECLEGQNDDEINYELLDTENQQIWLEDDFQPTSITPRTSSPASKIIQTQIIPKTILKPSIRGRPSTITVSKSPATYLPRATLNTIQGAKGTQQIRTPTPPSSIAGISPAFVRTSITPRTSSPISLQNVCLKGAKIFPAQKLQVGNSQVIYTTQSAQQVSNIANQGGNQIIVVSQQQQLINNQQNIHQGGNVQTVVPLAIGSRNAVVSNQQVVNSQQSLSGAQITNQRTPVYIHTRIPAASGSQVISVSAPSISVPSFSNEPTATGYYEQASPSSAGGGFKSVSLSSGNDSQYAVASAASARYSEKMIHSIITNSFQNMIAQSNVSHVQQQQALSNQQSTPVLFSPMVVESQSSQNAQAQQAAHQIIAMGQATLSNQFKTMHENYSNKTPTKMGSAVKREAEHHPNTPKAKKSKHDRSLDAVDSVTDIISENHAEPASAKKKDVVLKKPQASLLQTYNQNWNIIASEFEEIINDETKEMETINNVLKRLEMSEAAAEVEKVSDLIKGCTQRSRLIIDSFSDSKRKLLQLSQIVEQSKQKIFSGNVTASSAPSFALSDIQAEGADALLSISVEQESRSASRYEGKYECDCCGKKFRRKGSVIIHLESHVSIREVKAKLRSYGIKIVTKRDWLQKHRIYFRIPSRGKIFRLLLRILNQAESRQGHLYHRPDQGKFKGLLNTTNYVHMYAGKSDTTTFNVLFTVATTTRKEWIKKKCQNFTCSHLCGKRACVNPRHLEHEPQSINLARKTCHKRKKCSKHEGAKDCLIG